MKSKKHSLLSQYLPISHWIRDYQSSDFKNDFRAGMTVSVLLIPQSMAYATLAGLPAVYGLYASTIALLAYALFGTSRQLGIGPVAITSILMASGISVLAEPQSARYIQLVIVTTFFVGLTQFLMGTFRLGFLMNFLSKPVLSGFTTAAALIIGFSQAGSLLGIEVHNSKYVYVIARQVVSNLGNMHMPTLIIGLACVALIVFVSCWKPRWPVQFLAVAGAIAVVWFFQLNEAGVEIVGSVKGGFPAPRIPAVADIPFWRVLPTVLAIAFLGFIQSIALAKVMVRRNPNYKIDSNQELFGIGLANMAGSLFNGYAVAGSFSRTAINDANGAKTAISLIISAALVTLVVFYLTPFIYYLPLAALGAIIITAVAGLVDIAEAKFLWKVRRREWALMAITFVATVSLGILEGIGVGVLISLGIVIHRSSYPNIAILGRLPGTNEYRDLDRYPEGRTKSNTIVIRVDAALYFANVPNVIETLEQVVAEREQNIKRIIFDANGINKMDTSAVHAIKQLVDIYHDKNILVCFARVKGPVRDTFRRSGLDKIVGEEKFYPNLEHAMDDEVHEVKT